MVHRRVSNNIIKQARDYLSYYVKGTGQRYAVLIEGPWGSGKTFAVRAILKELLPKSIKPLWVSLFGKTTLNEITYALIAEAADFKQNVTTHLLRTIENKLGKNGIAVDPAFLIGDPQQHLIIIDDLERASIKIKDLMGYINDLVEHRGYRVVIIASEDHIADRSDYIAYKEKVIGKTIQVEPDADAAVGAFVKNLNHGELIKFVLQHHREVTAVFTDSNCQNLRLLQHALWDLDRLFSALVDIDKAPGEALLAFIRAFLAISIACRSQSASSEAFAEMRSVGSLRLADIETLSDDEKKLNTILDRHPDVNFERFWSCNAAIVDVINTGRVNSATIQEALFFSADEVTEHPPWRKAWRAFHSGDEGINDAIELHWKSLAEANYVSPGILLHCAAIELALTSAVTPNGRDKIVEKYNKFISEMGQDEVTKHLTEYDEIRKDSFGGYHFVESNNRNLEEVREALRNRFNVSICASASGMVERLLSLAASGDEVTALGEFASSNNDKSLASVPFLHFVNADDFYRKLRALNTPAREVVFKVLAVRQQTLMSFADARGETTWIDELVHLSWKNGNGTDIGGWALAQVTSKHF